VPNASDEPPFTQFAHGSRPGRGGHTALTAIPETWEGAVGCIAGDIAAGFSSLAHAILRATPAAKSPAPRCLRLVAQPLTAGD
jgi:hypothetical protein